MAAAPIASVVPGTGVTNPMVSLLLPSGGAASQWRGTQTLPLTSLPRSVPSRDFKAGKLLLNRALPGDISSVHDNTTLDTSAWSKFDGLPQSLLNLLFLPLPMLIVRRETPHDPREPTNFPLTWSSQPGSAGALAKTRGNGWSGLIRPRRPTRLRGTRPSHACLSTKAVRC